MVWNPVKLFIGVGAAFAGIVTGQPWLIYTGVGMALSAAEPDRKQGDVATNLRRRQSGSLLESRVIPGEAMPVVYGQVKAGISINDFRTDTVVATNPKDLYMCGVISHGSRDGEGIASIDEIYYDDRQAYTADATHVAPFAATNTMVEKLLGTDSQNWGTTQVDGISLATNFSTYWDSNDAGKGLAGILAKLIHDPDI